MTAIARCIEALYSRKRQPISTALALRGLRLLHGSLRKSVDEPYDLEARGACQVGCLMSGIAAINAMVSLVHAVGHVVGGKFRLQHGIAHSILLSSAMRLLLPAIGDEQIEVYKALGGNRDSLLADEAGEKAASLIDTLVSQLPLDIRLRDVGITESDLEEIAGETMKDYMMPSAPRTVTRDQVLSLLRLAL